MNTKNNVIQSLKFLTFKSQANATLFMCFAVMFFYFSFITISFFLFFLTKIEIFNFIGFLVIGFCIPFFLRYPVKSSFLTDFKNTSLFIYFNKKELISIMPLFLKFYIKDLLLFNIIVENMAFKEKMFLIHLSSLISLEEAYNVLTFERSEINNTLYTDFIKYYQHTFTVKELTFIQENLIYVNKTHLEGHDDFLIFVDKIPTLINNILNTEHNPIDRT